MECTKSAETETYFKLLKEKSNLKPGCLNKYRFAISILFLVHVFMCHAFDGLKVMKSTEPKVTTLKKCNILLHKTAV